MFDNAFAFSLCVHCLLHRAKRFSCFWYFTTIIISYEARSRIQNKHGMGEMGIFLIHIVIKLCDSTTHSTRLLNLSTNTVRKRWAWSLLPVLAHEWKKSRAIEFKRIYKHKHSFCAINMNIVIAYSHMWCCRCATCDVFVLRIADPLVIRNTTTRSHELRRLIPFPVQDRNSVVDEKLFDRDLTSLALQIHVHIESATPV